MNTMAPDAPANRLLRAALDPTDRDAFLAVIPAHDIADYAALIACFGATARARAQARKALQFNGDTTLAVTL